MNRATLSLTLALTACASSPELDTAGLDHPSPATGEAARLTAYTGSECSELPLSAFEDLQDLVDAAYDHAEADYAANGVTGRYPATATNAFNRLGDARLELDELMVRAGGWTSTARSRGQAAVVGVALMRVIDDLNAVGHWASISTIYHDSSDARQAMEGSLAAIEEANGIRATALRCYVGTDGL